MATQNVSLIRTKTRMIDGLSIRYAESPLREVSAILLSKCGLVWPNTRIL
jgi:hypothetical protein